MNNWPTQFTSDDLAWARALPKPELHAHVNGSVSRSDLVQLALADGITLPSNSMEPFSPGFDLAHVFQMFGDTVYRCVRDEKALRFVVGAVVKAFRDDGCCYLELRTTPRKTEHMNLRQYVETVLGGVAEEVARYGGEEACNMKVLSFSCPLVATGNLRRLLVIVSYGH